MGSQNCRICYDRQDFSEPLPPIIVIEKSPPHTFPQLAPTINNHLLQHKPFQFIDNLSRNTVIRLPNSNNFYEGTVNEKGKPEGYGKICFNNSSVFEGQFRDGQINGNGHLIYANGGCIYGEVIEGMLRKGVFISNDGLNRYEGELMGNQFHGKGKQIGINYEFHGTYKKGKRIKGTFKYNSQQTTEKQYEPVMMGANKKYWEVPEPKKYQYVYQGQFDQNAKFTGKGQLIGPQGTYVGEFQNGMKHGKGEFQFRKGTKYIGQYRNNKKEGQGTILSANNLISYEGEWKAGLPHGKGFTMNKLGDKREVDCIEGIDQNLIGQQ